MDEDAIPILHRISTDCYYGFSEHTAVFDDVGVVYLVENESGIFIFMQRNVTISRLYRNENFHFINNLEKLYGVDMM